MTVAASIQDCSIVDISNVESSFWAMRSGLLNRKFAKVELAPGPPLSQIAIGASALLAGYIHQKS